MQNKFTIPEAKYVEYLVARALQMLYNFVLTRIDPHAH